jgi:hypothetical protein
MTYISYSKTNQEVSAAELLSQPSPWPVVEGSTIS